MTCLTSKAKSGSLTIRLPQQEKDLIAELACEAGLNPSELVRMSLRSTLELIARTTNKGIG